MKSLVTCLLLLMTICYYGTNGDCVSGTYNEDCPPLVSVKELVGKLELKSDGSFSMKNSNEGKPKFFDASSHIVQEASRVAVVQLESTEKYLMRFDPPEHCARIVICTAKQVTQETFGEACEKAANVILLNPLGDGTIYEKDPASKIKDSTIKSAEKNVLISMGTKDSKTVITFQFNARSDKKKIDWTVDTAEKNMIRIETSSFYCNVRIGTTGSTTNKVPSMRLQQLKYREKPTYDNIDPFPLGKAIAKTVDEKVQSRKYFGPLFNKYPDDQVFEEFDDRSTVCKAKEVTLTLKDKAQCPFSHDWMGFSKWTKPAHITKFKNTFWQGPMYQYALHNGNNCGELDNPRQLDIEFVNKFDAGMDEQFGRCFGFALVFSEKDKPFNLDPAKTFEFYPVASMFIAPDSEKVRSLRTTRDGLQKIRISFYKKAARKFDSPNYDTDFAIVEYDFLNENIAGVREYVALPEDTVNKYEFVTLFSEGYCAARLLTTKDTSECWSITGCDVFERTK